MPKKFTFNPADPMKAIDWFRDHFTAQKESLASSEFMKAADKLPANLRAEFDQIKAGVDEVLVGLSSRPTDQVPAAQQAAWGLEMMARSIVEIEEMRTKSFNLLEEIQKRYNVAHGELSTLKLRVEKKELVEQKDAEKAVADARQEEQARFAMFGKRRGELMTAGLPTPATDELLGGEQKEWDARLTEAKQRHTALKEFDSFEKMSLERKVKVLLGAKDGFEDFKNLASELSGREIEPLGGGAGGGEGDEGKDKGGEGRTKEKPAGRRFAV